MSTEIQWNNSNVSKIKMFLIPLFFVSHTCLKLYQHASLYFSCNLLSLRHVCTHYSEKF